MNLSQNRMSFDLLQRYRMTSELIEIVRRKKPLRILDVGSREGFLERFLPEDLLFNLDIGFFPGDSFLVGDLLNLPFPPDTFDISLSLDVLEHVEPSKRRFLFDEMARVSRDFFIVGAPFNEEKVVEAEKLANEFHLKMSGKENMFLTEHIDFGLPDLKEVMIWLEEYKFQYVVLPNNYLPRWLIMICLNAYISRLPKAEDLISAVTNLYDHQFSKFDNRDPAYRHIIFVSKLGNLNKEMIYHRFVAPEVPPDFHHLAWNFANGILSELALHHERVLLEIQEENNELQNEKYEIQRQLEVEKDRYFRTRLELEGIKGTFAYKLYQKTIGRAFNRSVPR